MDDLIVGALGSDPHGFYTGASYVILGQAPPVTFVGGAGDDVSSGGALADSLSGGGGKDTLNGLAGDDSLDGGLDADIMSGGTENDVYIVDNAGDQTIELAAEGYDIVRTTLSWILADNLEALELQAAADAAGTGNRGANNLQGNAGANTLSGLAGVDTLNGNDGDDIIIGGQGNDLLRGGLGLDTFRVAHAFGGTLETDQIYDFQTAEGDLMDFSALFAGTIARVSAFTHVAGQMTLTFAAGITTVRLDIDGNGTAEYQAKINGDVTADWGGWML